MVTGETRSDNDPARVPHARVVSAAVRPRYPSEGSFRPRHHVILELLVRNRVLADGAAADGDAGSVDRLRVAGDKRMPPVEVAPLVDQTIGAGGGQPGEPADHV